ncbi:MAG: lysophospholipid acyltransferase family protein [Bdellovibrionota bacterium]
MIAAIPLPTNGLGFGFRFLNFHIRGTLVLIWFFCCAFAALFVLPFRWKDPSMSALFARWLAWGCQPALGVSVRVEGEHNVERAQPCVYAVNHQSNIDVITMAGMYPWRTVVIGKEVLKWIPFFGLFFIGTGNILINRRDRKNSLSGLAKAAEAIRERNVSVWIFPEGTRNHGRVPLLPFKKGAFYMAIQAQVPVVPIVNDSILKFYDFRKKWIRPANLVIKVLDPIPTLGMTDADVPSLMARVRDVMEAAQSPVSE